MQTIRRCDQLKGPGNGIREQVGRPDLPFSQDGLQFRPHLFDGIQVRAVRRQIQKLNMRRLKDLTDALNMMRAKIIHYDNIPRLQRWDKMIPQISRKPVSCRSTRVGHGDMTAIRADGGQYRRRFRRIQRRVVDDPRFADASPVDPRHVGVYAAFVQIDKVARVNPGQLFLPRCTSCLYIGRGHARLHVGSFS